MKVMQIRHGHCAGLVFGLGCCLTLLPLFAATPSRGTGALSKRIERTLQRALRADRLRGAEGSYPSDLPLVKQQAMFSSEKRHFHEALRYYRRVVVLLGEARRSDAALPPRLEERALALSAWALNHNLGDPKKWTFRATARKITAAAKLQPRDPMPDVLLAQLYYRRGRALPSGERPVMDHATGKIVKWIAVRRSRKQIALRRHDFLKSAFFAELALRLDPGNPVANKDLESDLFCLRLDQATRGYYFARAYEGRKRIDPLYFHFESYLLRNFQWNLEHEMGAIHQAGAKLPGLLAKVKSGIWRDHPPELPKLPAEADGSDPAAIDFNGTGPQGSKEK